jgi:hypothetical protein
MENTTETLDRYKLSHASSAQPNMNLKKSNSNDITSDIRINMELPFSLGSFLSGSLKWGGRYKNQDHEQDSYEVTKASVYFSRMLLGTTVLTKEDGSTWNEDIPLVAGNYDANGWV